MICVFLKAHDSDLGTRDNTKFSARVLLSRGVKMSEKEYRDKEEYLQHDNPRLQWQRIPQKIDHQRNLSITMFNSKQMWHTQSPCFWNPAYLILFFLAKQLKRVQQTVRHQKTKAWESVCAGQQLYLLSWARYKFLLTQVFLNLPLVNWDQSVPKDSCERS